MEKILTISVAAYNMEAYLRQTLDSLVIPEIVDDLEVFVIDDGGQDGSLEIAREYEARYPLSFHAVHKENGGYGTTVNYSIAHATGKYFKLLDGDDWFDRDGLVRLVWELRTADADIVATHIQTGPDAQSLEPKRMRIKDFDRDIAVRDLDGSQIYYMWYLTYRTEVLRASNLKLPEHLLYTDRFFGTIPFAYAKTIRFLDASVYCYRLGRDGQSVSREQRIKHAQDALDICLALCEFYVNLQRTRGEEPCAYLHSRMKRQNYNALKTLLILPITRENRRKMRDYDNAIRRLSPDIYENCLLPSGKISNFIRLLRKTNYRVYWLLAFLPNRVSDFA